MTSQEYKLIISRIVRNSIKNFYPGLKVRKNEGVDNYDIGAFIARAIHARMYGANVDGVDSPIWHNTLDHDKPEPKKDAKELLNGE